MKAVRLDAANQGIIVQGWTSACSGTSTVQCDQLALAINMLQVTCS